MEQVATMDDRTRDMEFNCTRVCFLFRWFLDRVLTIWPSVMLRSPSMCVDNCICSTWPS